MNIRKMVDDLVDHEGEVDAGVEVVVSNDNGEQKSIQSIGKHVNEKGEVVIAICIH